MLFTRSLGLGLAAALLASACKSNNVTGPAVATVSVTLTKTSLFVGETTTATASLSDANGLPILDRSITWSSGTTSVATAGSTGTVTAVGPGTSVITATSEGQSGTATITVIAPVATVAVTLAASSITVGATTQASVVLKDAGGNTLGGRTVAWTSGTTSVATIDGGGLITGVSAGTSTITATAEGKTGSSVLTVIANPAGSFNLSSPSNRSANESTTPQLSWSPASGATSYTLEVATANAFGPADVVNQTGITGTGFTPSTALTVGTVYFWRVTAVNSGGSTLAANGPFEFSVPFSVGHDPYGVAITPDGSKMLVVNSASGTGSIVTVVNLSTKQTITTIPTGSSPSGAGQIVIRADGQQAVAANSNSLAVIDLTTNTVTKTIPMPCVGTSLGDIAYTPDGTRIVLADLSNGCTTVGMRIVTISSGASTFVDFLTQNPLGSAAVMPNGTSALVGSGVLGTTERRVDLSTGVITTITGTGPTFAVAITPDNSSAVVAGGDGATIKRIDLNANTVSVGANFGSGPSPHTVAITPDGMKAVVTGGFNTAIIKLSDNSIIANIPTGGATVAITPDGKYALFSTGAGSGTSGTVRIVRIP